MYEKHDNIIVFGSAGFLESPKAIKGEKCAWVFQGFSKLSEEIYFSKIFGSLIHLQSNTFTWMTWLSGT